MKYKLNFSKTNSDYRFGFVFGYWDYKKKYGCVITLFGYSLSLSKKILSAKEKLLKHRVLFMNVFDITDLKEKYEAKNS